MKVLLYLIKSHIIKLLNFIGHNWALILAVFTVLSVFLPLNPFMPQTGIDNSWIFSMNSAVAENFYFGKDVIFSFGPYASIFTQSFYPSTYKFIFLSSFLLGSCYAVALFYTGINKNNFIMLAFSVFLSSFMMSRDALIFSYSLMLTACTYIFINGRVNYEIRKISIFEKLTISFIIAPLGLLPLIKGSFLLIAIFTIIIIATYLFYYKYYKLSAFVTAAPILFLIFFWILSGQPVKVLPNYLFNLTSIISGYTDAMSLNGNNVEILSYILICIFLIWSLVKTKESFVNKLFLTASFTLFLFIAFKGGFVRHDCHALIASDALIFAAIILNLLYNQTRNKYILVLSVIVWASFDKNYTNTTTRQIFSRTNNCYFGAYEGLHSRIFERNRLNAQFDLSTGKIRNEYMIQALQGTTDIYSYDQSFLLVSENKWNPRPIIQSYSAYTPKLSKINEQHLRHEGAPENILFRVQPIDGHLPSLEDGLSWPAIFDNYTVTTFDNDLVYLTRNESIRESSLFKLIQNNVCKIGAEVLIPRSTKPLYAEIDIKPSFLGRLMGIIYKQPQLKIKLKFANGSQTEYRVIANMMKSGFFLSPLTVSTRDFVYLATGNQYYLNNNRVISFEIVSPYGGALFWKTDYDFKIKEYGNLNSASLPPNIFDKMSEASPPGFLNSDQSSCQCDGNIDLLNEIPLPGRIIVSGSLSVEGWLALSAKDGILPDSIFVTLTKQGETAKYISTKRKPRDDVKEYFNQMQMRDAGFTSNIDISSMNGDYILGFAVGQKGKLELCTKFKVPLTIVGTNNQ